jgi:hypothetical protein
MTAVPYVATDICQVHQQRRDSILYRFFRIADLCRDNCLDA